LKDINDQRGIEFGTKQKGKWTKNITSQNNQEGGGQRINDVFVTSAAHEKASSYKGTIATSPLASQFPSASKVITFNKICSLTT